MDGSWPLLVIGVLIGLGFGALIWRRRQEGVMPEARQPNTSSYLDLVALGLTVLVVGSLAMTQLGAPPAAETTPTPPTEVAANPSDNGSPGPAGPLTGGIESYTVQEGDTLESIAEEVGVAVAVLREVNDLTDEALEPGQTLSIPVSAIGMAGTTTPIADVTAADPVSPTVVIRATIEPTPTVEATPTVVLVTIGVPYTVQDGDTIEAIAIRFGVGTDAVLAANPGVDPATIQLGQVISVPQQATATVPPPPTETPRPTATPDPDEPTPTPTAEPPTPTPEPPTPTAEPPTPTPEPPTPVPPTATPVPPPPPPPPPAAQSYVVRQGDTLFSIATRFGVSTAAIIQANPNINPDALQLGQTLSIPTGAAPAPTRGIVRYTVRQGDTLNVIAIRFGVTVPQLVAVNPGITPSALRVGGQINIPNQPLP